MVIHCDSYVASTVNKKISKWLDFKCGVGGGLRHIACTVHNTLWCVDIIVLDQYMI